MISHGLVQVALFMALLAIWMALDGRKLRQARRVCERPSGKKGKKEVS